MESNLPGLTTRMEEVVRILYDHQMTGSLVGMPYADIAMKLGVKSRAHITRIISQLRQRGWIVEAPKQRHRTIRLTDAAMTVLSGG